MMRTVGGCQKIAATISNPLKIFNWLFIDYLFMVIKNYYVHRFLWIGLGLLLFLIVFRYFFVNDIFLLGDALKTNLEFIGISISIIAILISIWQLKRQVQLQNFINYTTRYAKLCQEIDPVVFFSDILHLKEDLLSESNPNRLKFLKNLMNYFDLISEEYFLNEQNLIPKDVWDLWQSGLVQFLKRPLIQTAWINYISQLAYGDKFPQYINNLIKTNSIAVKGDGSLTNLDEKSGKAGGRPD
jgi:hypothetical protein